MNLILLPSQAEYAKQWVITDPRQLQHISGILQPAIGMLLKVGVVGGRIGVAKVSAISAHNIVLTDIQLTKPPPAALPLTLIVALPRPKVLRRLVSDVCALGVKRLIFIHSYQVEKSYWQSPLLAQLNAYAQLGLEQALDTVNPDISMYKRFKPFVEDVLPTIIANQPAMVAHPYAQHTMPQALNRPACLIIGAEGGFIPYEIQALVQQGVQAVSLGDRILRTEAVVNYCIGRLYGGV